MNQRLRALERLLVCQRDQVLLAPLVESFVDAWQQALAQAIEPPKGIDLLRRAAVLGVRPLAATPVVAHVDECQREGTIPDPQRLIEAIVHGFSEMHLAGAQPCHCIAKRPLSQPRGRS